MPKTTVWVKEIPAVEGWYWIKYRGKNGVTKCPGEVFRFNDGGYLVRTANNCTFVGGPKHGGPEPKTAKGGVDKSVRFGPRIEAPAG